MPVLPMPRVRWGQARLADLLRGSLLRLGGNTMKPKFIHDETDCGATLLPDGTCPHCGFIPDMQSIVRITGITHAPRFDERSQCDRRIKLTATNASTRPTCRKCRVWLARVIAVHTALRNGRT